MTEIGESIKIVAEVAIAAITALGTVWAALRQSRQDIRSSATESFQAMIKDMTQERDELLDLIRQERQQNLELRKQLARMRPKSVAKSGKPDAVS